MDLIPTVLLFLSVISTVSSQTIEMMGTNVYSYQHEGIQYFIYNNEMDATITCKVSGTTSEPNIAFLKDGSPVSDVLPASLFNLEFSQDDTGAYVLKLKINASGYQNIVGNWSCVAKSSDQQPVSIDFVTLCTSRPEVSFDPPLRKGVARQGTTITLHCECNQLDVFRGDMQWAWFVDGASPAGNKFQYVNSPYGYPTDTMKIYDLEDIDTAKYGCNCIIGQQKTIQFTSETQRMTVMEPPGKPKDITLLDKTGNSLEISWLNSENMGVVINYEISYKGESESYYRQIRSVEERRYTLTGLNALTQYSIKIVASNYAGEGDYSDVAVFNTSQPSESKPVIHPPKDIVYNQETQTYLKDVGPGVDISLSCEVRSYPPPVIEWWLNNQRITTTDTQTNQNLPVNFEKSLHKKNEFLVESVLVIRKTRDINTGDYQCIASNTKGRDVLNYELRVTPTDTKEQTATDSSPSTSLHLLLSLLVTLLWAAAA